MEEEMIRDLQEVLPDVEFQIDYEGNGEYRLYVDADKLTKEEIYDFIAVFQEHGFNMKSLTIYKKGVEPVFYFELEVVHASMP